jgi:hypothetical protein
MNLPVESSAIRSPSDITACRYGEQKHSEPGNRHTTLEIRYQRFDGRIRTTRSIHRTRNIIPSTDGLVSSALASTVAEALPDGEKANNQPAACQEGQPGLSQRKRGLVPISPINI